MNFANFKGDLGPKEGTGRPRGIGRRRGYPTFFAGLPWGSGLQGLRAGRLPAGLGKGGPALHLADFLDI